MELKKLFEVKENKEINIRIQCTDTDKYIAVHTLTSNELKLIEMMRAVSGDFNKLGKAYYILREFIAQSIIKYQHKITISKDFKDFRHSLEEESLRKINSETLNNVIKEAIKSYCNDLDEFTETYREKINH